MTNARYGDMIQSECHQLNVQIAVDLEVSELEVRAKEGCVGGCWT